MGMPIPDTLAGRTACIQLRRRGFAKRTREMGTESCAEVDRTDVL